MGFEKDIGSTQKGKFLSIFLTRTHRFFTSFMFDIFYSFDLFSLFFVKSSLLFSILLQT